MLKGGKIKKKKKTYFLRRATSKRTKRNLCEMMRMELVNEEEEGISAIVLIGEFTNRQNLLECLQNHFSHYSILSSSHGSEYRGKQNFAFVLEDFSSGILSELSSNGNSVYGPTALLEYIEQKNSRLSILNRPLYNHAMSGLIICFTGYRNKEDLKAFLAMIHNMGGSIRREFGTKITHLVASDCSGDKYRYAATFGIPIVSSEWISKAWDKRYIVNFKAESLVTECQVKPFHGAKIYLFGFSDKEERDHMLKELTRNGGVECNDYKTEPCTHIVVDDTVSSFSLPSEFSSSETFVVKSEWFWASIQMDACAEEKMFHLSDHGSLLSPRTNNNNSNNNNNNCLSPHTPGSRKRKRANRKEIVNALAQTDSIFLPCTKPSRRSSVGDVNMLSVSGSFLDTPDDIPNTPKSSSHEYSSMTPRQQVFTELLTTESNYVNILKTIIDVFQRPLESPDKVGGQFLNHTEMKLIFGNLTPICDLHSKMLNDFSSLASNWRDDCSIGQVFLSYAHELLIIYPPFVNFFETTKASLSEASKRNPRFHAFLKVCQSKPECGRQTLSELLIRPVQRLPSVSLLLQDLLKHTKKEKDHPDTKALEEALAKIKEVMTHINEDKRRTEGQMHIFDIFKDIENCPPNLVSSHRSFFCKVQVMEIGATDELCGKGYELALFLFSDVLEISKKRSLNKGLGFRSPSALSLTNSHLQHVACSSRDRKPPTGIAPSGCQQHKHVDLMNLTSIKRVVDVPDSDEHSGVFALVCRSNQELKEKMFIFQMSSPPEMEKMKFLRTLCRNVANTMCRPDPDTYLTQMRPEDLELESSDLNVSNLSRAYVRLHRTKQKVGRAFSFNKTPTNALKRAVSSMISPLANRERLHSTPSGDLQAMRLSSCSNLMCAESPKNSRPDLTSSPKSHVTSTASLNSAVSTTIGDSPQKDGSFTIPRTPQLSSRRPSFKFKSKCLSKKF